MLPLSKLECVITFPRPFEPKFQNYMSSNPHAALFLTGMTTTPYIFATLIYGVEEIEDCKIFYDAAQKHNISDFSVEISGLPIDICHEVD